MAQIKPKQSLLFNALALVFFEFASATTCRALLEHGLDPRPYVSNIKVRSDGRGNLAPPISSKIFIAWRSRTPPHIPDTAFYAWWIKEDDVLRLSLEAGDAAEPQAPILRKISDKGVSLQVPSGTALMTTYLKKTFSGVTIMQREWALNKRALTFLDADATPYVFILDKDKSHNVAAKQILAANPNLSFYSSDNVSLKVFLNSSDKIQKVVLLKPQDTSLHLSSEVLDRAVSAEMSKSFDKSSAMRNLFRSAIPEHLESPFYFEEEAEPSAPMRNRPFNTLK